MILAELETMIKAYELFHNLVLKYSAIPNCSYIYINQVKYQNTLHPMIYSTILVSAIKYKFEKLIFYLQSTLKHVHHLRV